MPNKPNAPLVYTIGNVRFPRVPGIERFCDIFFDKIRETYPFEDIANIKEFRAVVTENGVDVKPHERFLRQYSSVDRKWAFVLSDTSFSLHTNSYYDFNDFSEKLRYGLEILFALPNINIRQITGLGMRYVDLIIPDENSTLEDFLKEWVLSTKSPFDGLKILDSAYMARYKTELGELHLQAIRNPSFTLPYDLQSEFIAKNKWLKENPNREFALIDSDHVLPYEPPRECNIDSMIQALFDLHLVTKSVFENMGTPAADKHWNKNA